MNTYTFPLGNDTSDRDWARIDADLHGAPETTKSGLRPSRRASRIASRIRRAFPSL